MTNTYIVDFDDVQSWAGYSGDNNPVHFDEEAAKAFGVDFPFAHGMLSIIPVKSLIDEAVGEQPFMVDFRFARPLKVGSLIDVSITDGNAVTVTLQNQTKTAPLIYGSIVKEFDPIGWELLEDGVRIPSTKYSEPLSLSKGCIPSTGLPTWVKLEASAFSEFIHSGIIEVAIENELNATRNLREDYTLLHTRNKTFVNKPLLSSWNYCSDVDLIFVNSGPVLKKNKIGFSILFSITTGTSETWLTHSQASLNLHLNSKE